MGISSFGPFYTLFVRLYTVLCGFIQRAVYREPKERNSVKEKFKRILAEVERLNIGLGSDDQLVSFNVQLLEFEVHTPSPLKVYRS